MSEVFAHWPADYHPPEHPPEDQSWGWLIVLAVAALAVVAGVFIGWIAAVAVIVVAALAFVISRVRRRSTASRSTSTAFGDQRP